MKRPVYIVDAFTAQHFTGNQAAVCLSEKPFTQEEYQKIAAEFNLSETAFPRPINVKEGFEKASEFELRWFTPSTEVPLCGHATLATSHVLFNEIKNVNNKISFHTKSGVLTVSRAPNGGLQMNFPAYDITSCQMKHVDDPYRGSFPEFIAPNFLHELIKCIVPDSVKIRSVAYAAEAKKLIIVVDEETTNFELQSLNPDTARMMAVHPEGSFVRGVIVTLAPKKPSSQGFLDQEEAAYDYVCRYFAPWVGIREDPATGSAQCAVGPFWAKVLQKPQLYVLQSYPGRGAQFRVTILNGGRVSLVGHSVTIVRGEIDLNSTIPSFYEPND